MKNKKITPEPVNCICELPDGSKIPWNGMAPDGNPLYLKGERIIVKNKEYYVVDVIYQQPMLLKLSEDKPAVKKVQDTREVLNLNDIFQVPFKKP